ncbi:MAG TPA: hypothetical protein PKB09_00860 [Candidatus Saccharibacteria bacterium]|nr:hypothetical protein [Candidatus Saccharibacteria bacterium]
MDQTSKQSIIDRLGQATNVLVTVSSNPSVDQLSACIGFTLFLNKLGKHATAVFSGDVPSTIEFLQPDETLEKNTDSLRDFIISLDKTKADKLRYKVEDKVVKIFITPYKTSISEKDFDFSQGDFNVDAVVALGVHNRDDLDKAIIAHGRILHDATVISISNSLGAPLGTLDLQDDKASSLCEMLADIAEVLKPNSFDAQMATAFLTGIVAETKRFSNEKTSPVTMGLSAKLMAAGANQQLVATNLQAVPTNVRKSTRQKADGELDIDHSLDEAEHEMLEHRVVDPTPVTIPPRTVNKFSSPIRDVKSEDHSYDGANRLTPSQASEESGSMRSYPTQPPTMGGTLTANTQPESLEGAVNPLNESPRVSSRLTTQGTSRVTPMSPELEDKTLVDIEKSVNSPHVQPNSPRVGVTNPGISPALGTKPDLDAARNAVMSAATEAPAPVQGLGTKPMPLTPPVAPVAMPAPVSPAVNLSQNPVDSRGPNPINRVAQPPLTPLNRNQAEAPVNSDPTIPKPPPVPPPMMPPSV